MKYNLNNEKSVVGVAEGSEKVENIADAGASRFIEVFDHRLVFVIYLVNVCILFKG